MFQIVNPTQAGWLGGYTAKTAEELKTGLLTKRNSDNTVEACEADEKPDGFVWVGRTQLYAPTSFYAAEGEYVTLVVDHVRAVLDASFFVGGVLPSFGAELYTANRGLIDTSGAAGGCFGKVIQTSLDYRTPPNNTSDVVMIEAHFAQKV